MQMRKTALMLAVLTATACMLSGCGDSKPKTEDDLEQALEDALNGDGDDLEQMLEDAFGGDGADASEESSEEEEPPEAYEPLPEVLNAPITSGLIQIGDDVFKRSGYYTVNQFIAEFGDKYDFSDINPDGYIDYRSKEKAEIEKFDSHICITIEYGNYENYTLDQWLEAGKSNTKIEGERIKIGDAIVTDIGWLDRDYIDQLAVRNKTGLDYNDFKAFRDANTWYGGQAVLDEYSTLSFDEIPAFLEAHGYVAEQAEKRELKFSWPIHYGTYADNENNAFQTCAKMDEKNLFGVYPVFYSAWWYDLSNNKATGSRLIESMKIFNQELWSGGTNMSYINFSGTDLDGNVLLDLP